MSTNTASDGIPIAHVKTETSPLKESNRKQCLWLTSSFFNWESIENDHSGSLKLIVIVLFGTTGAITLALLAQVYYGEYQIRPGGSVSSDSSDCSFIGLDVMKKGGNAVDAAIATTICLGVVNFHITGLGGGGYLMLYNHQKRKVIDIIDFRETVPHSYYLNNLNYVSDGLLVGVPGLLKGLWEAHEKYGKLPWNDLIMPSSKLAKYGFRVSKNIVSSISHLNSNGYNLNLVKLIKSLREGENVVLPELAATLELIASKGADVFYNGSLAMDIVYTVKVANGSMSLNDMSEYRTSEGNPLRTRIADFDVIVSGSSSAGPLLLKVLDSIEILDLNEEVDDPADIVFKMSDLLHDHYISFLQKSEAFYEQPKPAASQVSVVDNEENYVSVSSGLNTLLGSQLLTTSGFILNNAVARGGVNDEGRPISLVSPTIVVQNNEVCGQRFVLGSGDVTLSAQVLTCFLIFKKNVSSCIESPRFHIDNKPRHIQLEEFRVPKYAAYTIEKLKKRLTIESMTLPYESINVIEKIVDTIHSYADSRGGGRSAQFK